MPANLTARQIKLRDRRWRQLHGAYPYRLKNRSQRKGFDRVCAKSLGISIGELRRMEVE